MADENARSWLLRCPACGEYVSVELDDSTEQGRLETAQCTSAHCFAFQYHDQTVEMLATVNEPR